MRAGLWAEVAESRESVFSDWLVINKKEPDVLYASGSLHSTKVSQNYCPAPDGRGTVAPLELSPPCVLPPVISGGLLAGVSCVELSGEVP